MHRMIAWFAKNDVAANLLMVFIFAMGILAISKRIPLEVFPDIQLDIVNVRVALPGASPEEVEKGISIRVEEAIQDIEGIKQISSRSSENSATITVEVESGFEPRELLEDIKGRVDSISSFPDSAERPIVALAQRKREVISAVVYGNQSEYVIREFADQVRDELSAIEGITLVSLEGERNYEISIELPEAQLQRLGLTLQQVADAVRRSSLDLSAGNIKTKGGEIFVRTRNQAFTGQDFGDIVVLNQASGSQILLRDIASIRDGFEESPVRTRFNSQPAVEIEVFRVAEQSAIDVADKVKDYIEKKRSQLPDGLQLEFWRDRSKIVKARLATLTQSAIQGGILVMLLLTLFLRPAVAFWVCVGIPISFMGAFAMLPELGITLNVISLFAFIIVLGIVVDDAIVTGENVYTHLQRGAKPLDAAINGTQEVAIPVTFGVMTTVAAFAALTFVEGRMSFFFAQIPLVVIPVLLFSLVESKLILPAHLKHVKIRKTEDMNRLQRAQKAISHSLERFVEKVYQPFLEKVLKYRYASLATMVAVAILTFTVVTAGFTRFIFFTRIQSEVATASLSMPVGTSFEITDRYIQQITEKARQLQQKHIDPVLGESVIMNIFSNTGSRGGQGNSGRVRFEIMPPEQRSLLITSSELVREWRQMVGSIPGAESLNYRAEIGRSSSPLDIQMSGSDVSQLEKVAALVRERLESYPSVFDIEDTLSNGKEELQFSLKPAAETLGISLQSLARQVRQAFYGFEVQRIQRGRDEVKVFVRYPQQARYSLATLDSLMIKLDNGTQVPFSELATVKAGRSPDTIYRIDRSRTANVRADIDKQNADIEAIKRDLEAFAADLNAQYPRVRIEMAGEAKDQQESFASMIIGLTATLFVIFTLLAIPFKSYAQPLIVMTVIPFGAIGAIMGHWIMGMDLSIMSIMGMLALVGVVVNDSLVMVDYINKRRHDGHDLNEAVRIDGGARFRPILLTSLTTFIGLMPLLFETSTQAQWLIPMAVSLGFGILFATFITLLIIPVNYLILEDVKRGLSRFYGRLKAVYQ